MKPINGDFEKKVTEKLNRYFEKLQRKLGNQHPLQILVHSDKLGISYEFPTEAKGKPYHMASIGKVFTATLLFQLVERGRISLEDNISRHLPRTLLEGLFVYEGVDYADQVTVKDLVAHTSGAADYFEDPVSSGSPFMKEVINHPETVWTPEALLGFSRDFQKPINQPGKVFHYSDTGYILLGLLIEELTGKPFHESLHEEFFEPLGMGDTYLLFCSEPANQPNQPIRKFWLNGTEASSFTSVSCDWAGGGIVTTPQDLLKFQMALRKGRLVRERTLKEMENCPNKFRSGIYYGLGMMEIHFEEFFFLLKGLPRVTGHIGILATHMFYEKETDTHILMNFGDTKQMTASFKALIEIINTMQHLPKS